MNRCSVTHSFHATQHQQLKGKHHDAAASPNSPVSSYQRQNLPIGRGIRLALVCAALSYRLDLQPETKVKLTVVLTSMRPGEILL